MCCKSSGPIHSICPVCASGLHALPICLCALCCAFSAGARKSQRPCGHVKSVMLTVVCLAMASSWLVTMHRSSRRSAGLWCWPPPAATSSPCSTPLQLTRSWRHYQPTRSCCRPSSPRRRALTSYLSTDPTAVACTCVSSLPDLAWLHASGLLPGPPRFEGFVC